MAAVSQQTKQRIALETAHNVRDLGGYQTADGLVTTSRFIRSDCFMPLGEADARILFDLNVRTVIDLRNRAERDKIPSNLSAYPEVDYIVLPIYPEESIQQDWSKMTSGNFTMGVLYIDMLDNQHQSIRKFFECAAAAQPGRILFHCSAGKDRTGLLSALLLKLSGVNDADIVQDYALTEILLAKILPALKATSGIPAASNSFVDEMLGSKPANMVRLLAHLREKYGTAESYLNAIGVSVETMEAIRNSMTERAIKHE